MQASHKVERMHAKAIQGAPCSLRTSPGAATKRTSSLELCVRVTHALASALSSNALLSVAASRRSAYASTRSPLDSHHACMQLAQVTQTTPQIAPMWQRTARNARRCLTAWVVAGRGYLACIHALQAIVDGSARRCRWAERIGSACKLLHRN